MKKLILFVAFLLSIQLLHSQWKESSFGIIESPIVSFGINGTTIYACTDGEGLYYTYNNGKSWTNYDITYLQCYYIRGVAFKGSNIYVATGSGVYLSTNSGTDWNAVNNGLSSTNVQCVAILGSYIFAGTKDNGVYYTTDNGANWHNVINGLASLNVKCLLVNGNNLIAGTYGGGVFISTDKGTSWKSANSGIKTLNVLTLAINNNILYAGLDSNGVCLSSDFGSSWTAMNNDFKTLPVYGFAFSGSNIFVTTYGNGVYFSPDNGSTWRTVNTGMAETKAYSLLVDGTTIYAGTLKKVYKGNIPDFNAITIQFNDPNPLTICSGDTFQITVPKITGGLPPFTYSWSPATGVSDTTISNPKLFPQKITIYTFTVKDNSTPVISKQSFFNVKVNPKPATPIISQDVDTLKVSDTYPNYQWYDSKGNLLAQGTGASTYIPQTNGEYYLIILDDNGCKSDSSNHIHFITTSYIVPPTLFRGITIIANPAANYIEIVIGTDLTGDAGLIIYNSLGMPVFEKTVSTNEKDKMIFISTSKYPSGVYFCQVKTRNVSEIKKFIILK